MKMNEMRAMLLSSAHCEVLAFGGWTLGDDCLALLALLFPQCLVE